MTRTRYNIYENQLQAWQECNHPKQIQDDEMTWQEIENKHGNAMERGEVDDPPAWRYSSARNCAGQPGLIDVLTEWP